MVTPILYQRARRISWLINLYGPSKFALSIKRWGGEMVGTLWKHALTTTHHQFRPSPTQNGVSPKPLYEVYTVKGSRMRASTYKPTVIMITLGIVLCNFLGCFQCYCIKYGSISDVYIDQQAARID